MITSSTTSDPSSPGMSPLRMLAPEGGNLPVLAGCAVQWLFLMRLAAMVA